MDRAEEGWGWVVRWVGYYTHTSGAHLTDWLNNQTSLDVNGERESESTVSHAFHVSPGQALYDTSDSVTSQPAETSLKHTASEKQAGGEF